MKRGVILGALALLTGCVTNGDDTGGTACLDHFNAGRHREAIQACTAREEALIKRQPAIEAPLLGEIMLVRARALQADGQHRAALEQAGAVVKRLKDDTSPAGRVVQAQAMVLLADIAMGQGAVEAMLRVIDAMQMRFSLDSNPAVQAEWTKALALRTKLAEKDFGQNRRMQEARLAMRPVGPRMVAGLVGQPDELAAARGRAPARRSLRDQGMIAAAAYLDGRYDAAIDGFRHMLAQPLGDGLKAWVQLGQAVSLMHLGLFADSLDLLDQIITPPGGRSEADGLIPDLARLEKSGVLAMLGRADEIEPILARVIGHNTRAGSPESRYLLAQAKFMRQTGFLIRLDGLNAWRTGQDLLRQFEADPSDDIQALLALAHLQQGLALIARGNAKAGLETLVSVEKRYRFQPSPQQQRIAVVAANLRGVFSFTAKRFEEAVEACQQARSDIDRQAQQVPRQLLPAMRGSAVICLAGALARTKGAAEALAALEAVEPELMASPIRGDRYLQAQFLVLKMALQAEARQFDPARQTYQQINARFDPATDRDLETILEPARFMHRLLMMPPLKSDLPTAG